MADKKAKATSAQPIPNKKAASSQPSSNDKQNYARLDLADAGKLAQRLTIGNAFPGGAKSLQKLPGYQQLADYMGVKQINSPKEVKKALGILGGASNSWATAQASRPGSGVSNYNSLNDYLKVLGPGATKTTPKPSPTDTTPPPPPAPTYTPTPLDPVDTTSTQTLPETLPSESTTPGSGMMAGGGTGAAGANKLGRAKSRLRQLGIYGRGTGLMGRGLQYGNALNK